MKKHYNVVAAVIEHEGKILCMQRGESKYSYTSLHWEFPGGKIEPGETPQEALHRELLEEMDYDVTVGDHIITVNHEYSDFSITMSAFKCQATTPLFSRKEHADHKWLMPEDLPSLDWCAADIPIMNEVTKCQTTHPCGESQKRGLTLFLKSVENRGAWYVGSWCFLIKGICFSKLSIYVSKKSIKICPRHLSCDATWH